MISLWTRKLCHHIFMAAEQFQYISFPSSTTFFTFLHALTMVENVCRRSIFMVLCGFLRVVKMGLYLGVVLLLV